MTVRRNFIKQLIAGGILLPATSKTLMANEQVHTPNKMNSLNDKIRIALIGKGGMGTADANCALSVPGVEITAVCDLYDARLEEAKKAWGNIFTTKNTC